MSYLNLQMEQFPNYVKEGFQDGLFVSKFREGTFTAKYSMAFHDNV